MSWLSALLGLDASHNAGVAQTNATNQQGLQNKYGAQAANVYGGLQQQGQQQVGTYNANYLNLLNSFGSMAGLGGGQINTRQGSGAAGATGAAGTTGAPGSGNLAAMLNKQPDQPNQPGQQNASNPYSLDPNQQTQLNQLNANIARQAQAATSSFTQQMQNSGINDPRALQVGTEQIQEHFATLAAESQTSFYEQIKNDKLKAMQELIGELGQYGQQGISQEEAAGSGLLGLASGSQAAANSQQSFALQQQNLANEQQGGLLHLLTQFLPGGTLGSGGGTSTDPNAIQIDPGLFA